MTCLDSQVAFYEYAKQIPHVFPRSAKVYDLGLEAEPDYIGTSAEEVLDKYNEVISRFQALIEKAELVM
jgi:hypothetical protein